MLYMKRFQGFTLIELLVVVLIIGILASIALPQYQLAVAKARLARNMSLLKAIHTAQNVYYFANNTYSADPSEWDIDLPQGTTVTFGDEQKTRSNLILSDGTIIRVLSLAIPPGEPHPRLISTIPQVPVQIYTAFDVNRWICYPQANALGVKLCKNLGCPANITIETGYCNFVP